MRYDDQRNKMVQEQLIKRGIKNSNIINAFLKVPRECFVSDEWKEFAYNDHPLTIGFKQTISQPYIVAYMMQLLDINKNDIVLEIGTGCGYQTALLAETALEVYTIERIEELLINAKKKIKRLDYKNVYYKIGDGCQGWVNTITQVSGFDKIIVSAASPEKPDILLSQLKNGGKLVIPQGNQTSQKLTLYEKSSNGLKIHEDIACVFVPLIGEGAWES